MLQFAGDRNTKRSCIDFFDMVIPPLNGWSRSMMIVITNASERLYSVTANDAVVSVALVAKAIPTSNNMLKQMIVALNKMDATEPK